MKRRKLSWVWIVVGFALTTIVGFAAWSIWFYNADLDQARTVLKFSNTVIADVGKDWNYERLKTYSTEAYIQKNPRDLMERQLAFVREKLGPIQRFKVTRIEKIEYSYFVRKGRGMSTKSYANIECSSGVAQVVLALVKHDGPWKVDQMYLKHVRQLEKAP